MNDEYLKDLRQRIAKAWGDAPLLEGFIVNHADLEADEISTHLIGKAINEVLADPWLHGGTPLLILDGRGCASILPVYLIRAIDDLRGLKMVGLCADFAIVHLLGFYRNARLRAETSCHMTSSQIAVAGEVLQAIRDDSTFFSLRDDDIKAIDDYVAEQRS